MRNKEKMLSLLPEAERGDAAAINTSRRAPGGGGGVLYGAAGQSLVALPPTRSQLAPAELQQ